ncbi:hypothetical protein ABMA28_015573 [Loxostege sticticalis]|uniref:Uncharacterized protein n=1 Tax=Loxostege sticticalis TaxID=481309 RepID=A0ABD0TCC4_LOXSC
MYVIYPADEVVSLTYSSQSLPRPRQRPTLDVLIGPLPLAPPSAHPPPPHTAPPRAASLPKTAPPETPERAPASPTPSLERPPKQRERTKVKLFKKLGRHEDNEFGKIVRTPAPDEFELPAPLPTPAFSRKNIFDRDFDALFEVASTPQFTANIRVTTPEPDRRSDVSAAHFPSPATSSLSLLPPRPYSEPASISPATSARTSTHSTPTPLQSSPEGSKSKKVSFFRKLSRSKEASHPRARAMQQPSIEMALRELTHPNHNEQLKNQQQVTFKLVKTEFFSLGTIPHHMNSLYNTYTREGNYSFARFRLTKETTLLLLHQIEDKLKFTSQRNNAVSPLNQILCTLRFYATGSQLITCGDLIGVDESTACLKRNVWNCFTDALMMFS